MVWTVKSWVVGIVGIIQKNGYDGQNSWDG
jgi:hypothetical protein